MRNVFFSHHYADAVLVQQVINCHRFSPDGFSFRDWRAWETVRYTDPTRIKRWIDSELDGSTVTVVLIGEHTHLRRWVHYEISQTVQRKKGILGIYIDKMLGFNQFQWPRQRGPNPFLDHSPRPSTAVANALGETLRYGGQFPSMGLLNQGNWPAANPPPAGNTLLDLLSHGQQGASSRAQSNVIDALLSQGRRQKSQLASTLGGGLLGSAPVGATWQNAIAPKVSLADETDCYCWIDDDGYSNIEGWIERAARAAVQ